MPRSVDLELLVSITDNGDEERTDLDAVITTSKIVGDPNEEARRDLGWLRNHIECGYGVLYSIFGDEAPPAGVYRVLGYMEGYWTPDSPDGPGEWDEQFELESFTKIEDRP